MTTAPARYAFTVDDWHRMGQAGLFGGDARVELLGGEVVLMSPVGDAHIRCVNRLTRLLAQRVDDKAVVSVQNPVILDHLSEPQPDLALLEPPLEAPCPRPAADVLLVVEVADTTLGWDRDHKAILYGRSGIPLTWIVDLEGQEVLVLREPAPNGYLVQERAPRGGHLVLPGLFDLGVDDVLGPPTARA
ncbi:MAG: Uma2 family endonuclease [Acidimicrobiales bacterium]